MVVVDEALAPGLAANAAAVMAMTLGDARCRTLVGEDFEDGGGERHPGLITTGLPVLRAPADELPALRARAVEAEVGVVGFPLCGQTTTDYEAFRAMVARPRRRTTSGSRSTARPRRCAASPASLGLLR